MNRVYLVISIIVFMCVFPTATYGTETPQSTKEQLSIPLGVTLSIVPGFGAGNYYAKNYSKGVTFTFLDASLTSLSIWAYTSTKVTDYSVISLGVIPTVLLLFKLIQVKSAYDDIEVYNNRYLFVKP